MALSCLALLPFFRLADWVTRALIARFGTVWRASTLSDWAGIVVLAFALSVVSTLGEPLINAYSRAMEHDADVYGQEAVHGIIAQPQSVGQQSFAVLGQNALDDPTQHPVFEWWFDTHPTIRFRAAFARAYDPWGVMEQPKYFRP